MVEANAAFANMLGYSVEEILTMSVWDWDAYLDHDYIKETLENIDVGGLYEETRHRHKDGTVLDIEMSNNCVYYAGTKLIFCLCRDVSERKKQGKRIHQLVATGALTGAFNRREFDRRLQEASNRFQRYGEHFSVIMFDVDHFKAVNDTHGHAVGDQVLIAIAKCIRSAIRSSDSFGR